LPVFLWFCKPPLRYYGWLLLIVAAYIAAEAAKNGLPGRQRLNAMKSEGLSSWSNSHYGPWCRDKITGLHYAPAMVLRNVYPCENILMQLGPQYPAAQQPIL